MSKLTRLLPLFLVLLISCGTSVECIHYKGTPVLHAADGKFSKFEIARFKKYMKKKVVITEQNKKILTDYASDMTTFIRRYIWKRYRGADGLRLYIASNQKDFARAWTNCSLNRNIDKIRPFVIGFYCPFTAEATLKYGRNIEDNLETYDHEEGHHQNNIMSERDEDIQEFPSEYNMRWKSFLRSVLDVDIGNLFFTWTFAGRPLLGDNNTISGIGKYRAGSLMFFFVANYYKGDLTKGAKFVFLSKPKVLRKFFYARLNSYKGKLSPNQIWMKEVDNLIGSSGLNAYLSKIKAKVRLNKKGF